MTHSYGAFVASLIQAAVILTALPASAAEPARCIATSVPTDSQDVGCTIDPAMDGRPLRFLAVFGGSHDDTRITLTATLDDQPLTCDSRSKTSLFAEDGEVRLDCGFRAGRVSTAGQVLKVALTVHHAQVLSSSLVEE